MLVCLPLTETSQWATTLDSLLIAAAVAAVAKKKRDLHMGVTLVVPASSFARLFSVTESVTGVFYTTVLISRLAALYAAQALSAIFETTLQLRRKGDFPKSF